MFHSSCREKQQFSPKGKNSHKYASTPQCNDQALCLSKLRLHCTILCWDRRDSVQVCIEGKGKSEGLSPSAWPVCSVHICVCTVSQLFCVFGSEFWCRVHFAVCFLITGSCACAPEKSHKGVGVPLVGAFITLIALAQWPLVDPALDWGYHLICRAAFKQRRPKAREKWQIQNSSRKIPNPCLLSIFKTLMMI